METIVPEGTLPYTGFMPKPRVDAAGGMAAMMYVFKKAHEAGGFLKLYGRLRSKNACKTCAVGMGGLKGGMVNESGHFPEVCKKSVQAQAADMAGAIHEEFFTRTPIRVLEQYTPEQLEKLGRLTFPVIARPGDTHYQRIGWEEALDAIGSAFQQTTPERTFFYSSGRSGNETAFLLQLIARAYGTPNIHNCSFYCHQASGVALSQIYGSGTASITLDDLEHTDLVVIAGANPASNHPRLITQLMHLRRRGGKVIIINPVKELGLVRFRIPSDWRSMLFGTRVSDLYLQPRVGADIALFKALLKGIIQHGGVDETFIREASVGWPEVKADIEAANWQTLLNECGISRAEIDETVALLTQAKRGVLMWAMGLTHHAHGVDNILAFCNIALARGWLGKPGSGLLPIRGHSNVQGVGSVGVAPSLKKAFALKLEELYDIHIPPEPGQHTYASMVAAQEGHIDAALMLGGNLYGSNPDSQWTRAAMQNIPFTVYISTKLNEGHFHGRGKTCIILPTLARDEEPQATTQESMFNYVRMSEGGKPAVTGEMRSETHILASIAERILPQGRFDWSAFRSHQKLREAIARVVPGYEAMEAMDRTRQEFQVNGRTFHQPSFATEDGKAHFYVTPLPQGSPAPDEFCLMTLRSEGQFNSVVYDEEDLYRGNTRRDVVMMNEADAHRLNLQEGDPVLVETEAGQMRVLVSIIDIAPGSLAMYYPEANRLVPRRLDPQSKTPAFKSAVAKVTPVSQI
jgi:molybdopterin-dependent oxidoreductase alpha subunit